MKPTFLLPLLLLLTDSPGVNIRVNPAVIMHGSSTWLTCRVTPDPANRRLVYGVVNSEHENTERQLDGSKAPITWGPVEIKRVPCDAGPAYCVVFKADGSNVKAIQQINVAGCEP
jgi:hypothetical protein